MTEQGQLLSGIEDIYADAAHWHVNTGGETIHAKRVPGFFRNLKWYASATWLIYLTMPYARWHGQQAILFDVPHRQFHLFALTIWPQDIWMLSLVLILLAITLFGVTAVAGRVWCGYFCFQTVWTDVFTWIEDKIEGNPIQRRKLDAAPWEARKIRLKAFKHSLWLVIAIVTGVTFAGYFADIYQLWHDYVTLQVPMIGWVVMAAFVFGTYVFAGLMREQVCFWLCPYARIQSVMVDKNTIVPTYDSHRGEPRGRERGKGSSPRGDCVDCHLCVGVCPTGVDIREGLQEGCITCGMCIDACNGVMDKVGKPRGLIRYMSSREMQGEVLPSLFKRTRVIVYSSIILLSAAGILYGLTHINPLQLTVLHERQPLFIRMSDGSIENKYTIKAVNKTGIAVPVKIKVEVEGIKVLSVLVNDGDPVVLSPTNVIPFQVLVRARPESLQHENTPIHFELEAEGDDKIELEYESVFVRPHGDEYEDKERD